MQRIYNILVSLLGESKQGYYDKNITQYQFNCAYCADEKGGVDNKYNLEISFSLGKFHCWSCGSAGPISRLIKSKGSKALCDEYFHIIKDIKENKYYDLALFKDNGDMFEERYVKLPKTFQKINLSSCRDKALKAYLEKRKITQDIIDFYNIGVTSWDEDEEHKQWRNRIIIPSYNSVGDLNYYAGRIYKANDPRPKYRNYENVKKYDIVFHEDKIQWDADIYLVEGIFDSIYYHNSIALMGKALNTSSELYSKLYERANANIIICLDNDTNINEAKRIYKKLDHGRLRGKIKYIKLADDDNHKDFGTVYEYGGREEIINIMKTAKSFSEVELIF